MRKTMNVATNNVMETIDSLFTPEELAQMERELKVEFKEYEKEQAEIRAAKANGTFHAFIRERYDAEDVALFEEEYARERKAAKNGSSTTDEWGFPKDPIPVNDVR